MPNPLELLLQRERERIRGGTPAAAAVAEPEPIEVPEDPETSSLAPRNQGAFLSALNWLSRPGQVVKNVITGNTEGALRQAADFVLDPIDAVIPFMDAIPEISRSQDYVEGADLVGIDRENDPVAGTVASLGVDIATDPLTYLGFGPLIQGAKAGLKGASALAKQLPKGAEAVEAIQKGADTVGRTTRSIFGEQRLSPEASAAMEAKKANQSAVRAASIAESKRIVGGLTAAEREVAGDILDNMRFENGAAAGKLVDSDTATLAERLAAHPQAGAVNAEAVLKAAEESLSFGQRQWSEGVELGIFRSRDLDDDLIPGGGIKDYIPRIYKGQTGKQELDEALGLGQAEMGLPSSIKKRSLQTTDEVVDFLKAEKGVTYVRDLGARLVDRGGQQASMAGRAALGRSVLGDAFNLADDTQRTKLVDTIREMAKTDPESAKVLIDGFKGLPPRGAFLDTLSKVNRVVKPMMVYGYAIPKVGSIIRNKVGGIWQALSSPEARGVAIPQARRFFSDLSGAVSDSMGLSIGKDKLGKALAVIDDATIRSGGIAERAAATLADGPGAAGFTGQQLADLFRSGTLDGFVSSENLVSEMARTGWKKKFQSITEWPGRMFRGVEDRMRAGMYLDLINKGKKSADASRITRESLFDYDISSVGNRTARDLIPFFQFSAKAIPQQAKFLAEKPFVAVGLASLLTEREGEPKPPWLEGRLAIPLGSNEEGGRNYLAGTGLPFEALASIPNPSGSIKQFGRDVGRSIVGAGQPVLKTGLAAAFGVDPYFGTPFGTYSKLPGDIDAGAAGRAINILRQTGITQPLESLAGTIGKAVDSRKSGGEKALDLLTGANVVSVDPDRALQQRLTEYLRNNPNIASVQTLYANTDDPEALALIKELNGTKARLREKRKAAESLNALTP